MSLNLISEHLFIVLAAGICSIALGFPLGILAYAKPKTRFVILWITDLLQTIPSLALLGIIMVILNPGKLTVIIGITLYSLLPIVKNTCIGFQEIDPGIREAARGMGMSPLYRILTVEFPSAFPTIFTGIRIAVVNAIGTAVFAAYVGGGGLGKIIIQGIRVGDLKIIFAATGVLMIMAAVLDFLMEQIEKGMRKKGVKIRSICIPSGILLTIFLILLSATSSPTSGLMLYDGDYSETRLMHRMVKILVEDKSDLNVTIKDQMSQVNNFKALKGNKHSCDLMISYDGTVLTTFLGQDVTDAPEGKLYEYVNNQVKELYDLRLLAKLGFNNTYAIAVPETTAKKYNLKNISDLIPIAQKLSFGAEHGFFSKEGSIKFYPFIEYYGLKFKDVIPVDMGLKYSAVENGNFDVTVVYATDGLNKKANLKILKDDLNFFPEYNGAFLVRNEIFKRFEKEAPDLEKILNLLADKISTEHMAELTYKVDVLGHSENDIAYEFLSEQGLLNNIR